MNKCPVSCDAPGGYQSNANRTKCVFNGTLEANWEAKLEATEKREKAQKAQKKEEVEKALEKKEEKIAQEQRAKAARDAPHKMVDGVSHKESCDAGYFRNGFKSKSKHYCTACKHYEWM
jgi:hypothetical protein